MCIYIPTEKEIQKMIWEDYVYEPMTKEDIEREQNVKVGGWFGERNGMWDRTTSDKQKEAVRQGALKHKPWLKVSKEAHQKGGKATKGAVHGMSKRIVIDGKEYDTIQYAAEDLNMPHSTIGHRCRSKSFPNYLYK